MFGWGRPRRDLPPVNYAESSEDDDFESGLNFKSPLQSPRRPVVTREGSPVPILGGPTLADNVDDELEEVQWKLHDIAVVREEIEEVTDLLKEADTRVGSDVKNNISESSISEEVENSGVIIGEKAPDQNYQPPDPPPEQPAIMPDAVAYDMAVAEDGEDVYKNIATLKLPFNQNDPKYWFSNFERKLKTFGVGKQKTKKDALHSQLPLDVEEEVKHFLRLEEDEEGDTPYKDLKVELLRLYTPKPEDAFDRALSRVMSGKPSTLAKAIINDICECRKPLSTACCAKTVFGMWRRSLPTHVKAHISNQPFNKDTYVKVMEIADNVWASHKTTVAQVAAAGPSTTQTTPNTEEPQTQQVAAVNQGRGRGNRGRGQNQNRGGNRGGNRGNSNNTPTWRGSARGGGQTRGGSRGGGQPGHPIHRGPRHPSNPPLEVCRTHWIFGGQAKWCEDAGSCPWKNFTASSQ